MNLYEFIKHLSVGGWMSVFIVASMLVEITPFIKFNPIGWLGKHLNADMVERVDKIEKKVDNHVAEGYRNYILNFQRALLTSTNTQFTYEEWKKAIKSCQDYENYCKENKIDNAVVSQAIAFIQSEYQVALANKNILSLPMPKVVQSN